MKKILKSLMALSICACTMMGMAAPASAAEPILTSFGNYVNSTIRVISYQYPNEELNVLTTSAPYNNCDVTLWSIAERDSLHNFAVRNEGGAKYSLRCATNTNFAVELYYGEDDKYNCDVYDTTRGLSYIAPEDYQLNVSTLNSYYQIYSLYDDGTEGLFKLTVSGTADYGAHNVRWTKDALSSACRWTVAYA